MRVLVTSPEVDSLTRYLRFWTKKLLEKYYKRHIFVCLDGARATRERTRGTLMKKNIDVALFNGHGSDKHIRGHDNAIIIGENDADLLRGKIVHALSCQTARTLGLRAKSAGALEYVGYDAKFVALLQKGKITCPLEDDTATLFLEPAFTAPKALLDGKAGAEAVRLAKQAYNRSILKALNSDIQSDNDQFIGFLVWDRDHLVAC